MEVFNIQAHKPCTGRAENAIPHQFGCGEVGSLGGEFSKIIDQVSNRRNVDAMGVGFLWAKICKDSCICHGLCSGDVGDLIVWHYKDWICSFLPLFCQYRFSWKPISTYMSLTLARLCGEWQLVSENYEARSRKYKALIVIFRILATNYFYRGISQFWLKYEAWIAIFPILAAIDRFSPISWKVESRWGKLESRWRNQKAVEEN